MAARPDGMDRTSTCVRTARLDTAAPGNEPPDEYTYDPGNPTPFLVDARELELSLNEDYRTVHAERKDLVAYTTAPLSNDTEITGPMTATLWAVTDAKDTDWNVMILHVYPDGRVERIQDGVMRARFRDGFDKPSLLEPGKAYKYDIDLWFTSRVIPAGHRLRVTVASAGFPKYDRNLNTGGDNERDTNYVVGPAADSARRRASVVRAAAGDPAMIIDGIVDSDGKTMMQTMTGTNAQGQTVNNTVVWEKQ